MSELKIKLEKRLLGYDIWIDTSGDGGGAYQKIQANKPPIVERACRFIDEMQEYFIELGLPDPLRLVSTDPSSGWQYCEMSKAENPEVFIGYLFIADHLDITDSMKEKLNLLSQAVDFLYHHGSGDIAAAYVSLFDFTQSYTLHWAEVDARPDMERGQTTVKAASSGGEQRASALSLTYLTGSLGFDRAYPRRGVPG
ncbi:hypothetical protein [Pseudosulfitobacter koreensis]|uniref:Uncharacterized protein n=1 Tax=Pseudosulfitobacter koreensis TaxID=2968472 RepID=A0ABT1Z562_9RHOB|nr:hypothetical protein [Pseudosulfitobacter koreense]MCR8828245.1 hypothetical protein [Pseudosulfitobacter koreense]